MRFLYDMVNERQIFPFSKATEAEDITEETTANTDNMMGRNTGASTTTQSTTPENDGEIDTNTDNLLGDEDNTGTPEETPDANAEGGEDLSGDDMGGEGEGDPLGEGEDDMSDTGATDPTTTEEVEPKDSFEAFRKKKLHAQYLALFDTLDTDIRLLAENLPNVQDSLAFNTLSNVNNNLTQCKEYVSKILSEEFDDTEYVVLMKKYVALNRVYDIAIKILEKYFEFKNNDK